MTEHNAEHCYSDWHIQALYDQCHYAECYYVECLFADCRGAKSKTVLTTLHFLRI
jgi:hypothetical protein